ncbi:MAG TPA: selenoneine biosynthesis selenosugar synthase SenB [Planctomycetota bacterium]|nr:selenoneine biosynthesis selenosugar synthase SenB [Planctomycetota bacterium]
MRPSLPTPLRVAIVTPSPRGSRSGNRVTALRWAGHLRRLGARVRIMETWQGPPCDLLVAVHAVKTAACVRQATAALPDLRVAVLLAGTDVYPQFAPDPEAAAALQRADVLIALQPRSADVLPAALRAKVRTIVQSATALPGRRQSSPFRFCVLAHLRPVKDPLLPLQALEHVPRDVRVELVIAGRALSAELAAAAAAAVAAEPRARWLGEVPRREARALLASSHACIVPSAAEGGANVVSEAIAAGTPLLATAIPGNLGLLGDDWPGLFPVGDAAGLGRLMTRAASDRDAYHDMIARTLALQPMVDPRRELSAWRALLAELRLGPA